MTADSRIAAELDSFRAPINRLLGLTEQLWESDLDTLQREDLTSLRRSAAHLVALINDCMDYAMLADDTLALERIPFNLRDLFNNTLNYVRMAQELEEAALSLDMGSDVPEDVAGDPGRIRQVVGFLLSEARRQGPGQSLRLSVHLLSDAAGVLEVELRLARPQAPEPSQWSVASDSGPLSNVVIAELVRRLSSHSLEMAEGGLFRLILPLDRATLRVRLTPPMRLPDLRGSPILVVVDNDANRVQLERMLRSWDMKPITVPSAQAAVEALKQLPSDTPCRIVVVDSSVAPREAVTVPRRVRTETLHRPRCLLLAWVGWRGEAARSRDAGYAGYLTRPITQSDFFDAMVSTLAQADGERTTVPVLVTRHVLRETRRRVKILIADDSRVALNVLQYLLEDRGYTVLSASSGEEAVAIYRQTPVDLIVMDVQMPGMDGLEASAEIRRLEGATRSHVPILAVSANANTSDRARCVRAGMEGYVSKPIYPQELFEAVDALLGVGRPDGGGPARNPMARLRGETRIKEDLDQFFHSLTDLAGEIKAALVAGQAQEVFHRTCKVQELLETFPAAAALNAATQLALLSQDGQLAAAQDVYPTLVSEIDRLRPILSKLARDEKVRILLAEDDDISRTVLEDMLLSWGYDVVAVSDGLEAWALLQADDPPRLAILDWMMPGMDGLQVCRAVRRKRQEPYIYLLLLTARFEKEDIVEGLDAGADDYLVKPVDSHELKVRLRAGRRVLELQEELISAREVLRLQATRDPLTGLLNRGALLEMLGTELARTRRQKLPVSLVIIDLDHFKAVNDTYGHHGGDNVLRESARRMRASVRPYDGIGRYGGEEFLIVLPGADLVGVQQMVERLRRHLAAEPINVGERGITVTASFGLACTSQAPHVDLSGLIRAADTALYRAKANGRNRLEVAVMEDFPLHEVRQEV